MNFDKIHQIKLQLIQEGWDIEEKYSNDGSEKLVHYIIWAKRYDWHGKFTVEITGHNVCFFETCNEINNATAMLKTIKQLHNKCQKAWDEFPDAIPFQTASNTLMKDVMFRDLSEARNYTVNENRYFK